MRTIVCMVTLQQIKYIIQISKNYIISLLPLVHAKVLITNTFIVYFSVLPASLCNTVEL